MRSHDWLGWEGLVVRLDTPPLQLGQLSGAKITSPLFSPCNDCCAASIAQLVEHWPGVLVIMGLNSI